MTRQIGAPETATALAAQLARSEVSAQTLVKRALARCAEPQNEFAFVELTRNRALQEAAASDERRARGAERGIWDGIPIAWKDLFDLSGHVTTAGSATFLQNPPARIDADVVAACRDQGLVTIGKTNLSEFAFSGLGLNPHFGTPANPFSTEVPMAPGGSSSGSAVAVANRIVPLAVGTDTSGSVRVPASFCGVFGFKASTGRYPKRGCFPLSPSLDSFGAFAHCVEDLIHLDAKMRRRGPGRFSTQTAWEDVPFVIPQSVVFDEVDPQILAVFDRFVSGLRARGAEIRCQDFPIFHEVQRLFGDHGTIAVAEAATIHEGLLNSERAALMDPRVRSRMQTSRQHSVADYIKLQWARRRLSHDIASILQGRLLLFPTVAIQPPALAEIETCDEVFSKINLAALRNTMIGSYLDMPGISIPVGYTAQGMPVGVLISGPSGTDDRILSAARVIEQTF